MQTSEQIKQHIEDLYRLRNDIETRKVDIILHHLDPKKHPVPDMYKEVDPYSVCPALSAIDSLISTLKEEGLVAALTEQIAEMGKCMLRVSAMDCDCARYAYTASFDTVEEALAWREDQYQGAEGPMSIYIVDEFEEAESRDLALEAFEDGHPHVVYT